MRNAAGTVGNKVEQGAKKVDAAADKAKDKTLGTVQQGAQNLANEAQEARQHFSAD